MITGITHKIVPQSISVSFVFIYLLMVQTLSVPFQETELRSRVLEEQLAGAEQRLEENQEEQENFRKSLRTLLELLDGKIFELTELRDTLARLIEEAS